MNLLKSTYRDIDETAKRDGGFTAEMLTAGVVALLESCDDYVPCELTAPRLVANCYRAMERLRPPEAQSEATTTRFERPPDGA